MQTLANIRTLVSPLLGATAGALSLESFTGFGFYLAFTLLTSVMVYFGPAGGAPEKYFGSGIRRHAQDKKSGGGKEIEGRSWSMWMEVALGGLGIEALMGFVMSWTLVYNLVGT